MNASRLILCTLLSLLSISLGVAASAVVFVDANAPGPAHDGTSWQTAYLDIQSGVNDALSATKNVWVATGAYSENVAITKNNVALYGGFKPDPNDPDPFGSRTPGSSVVTPAASSTSTFIAATGTRIDGFTIENGSADQGAAINSAGTNLIVVLCYILNNTSIKGAGIYAPGGYLSVQKCTFNNDKARDTGANPGVAEGGAIWAQNCALNVFESVFNSDVATVSNALISGPTARGGAIFASGGSGVRIDRCKFDACSATGSSLPTYYAYGGAIFIKSTTAYVNSSFISNSSARGAGDRKTSYGGGIAFLNPGTINIRNNTFVGNEVVPNAGSITDTDRPYGLGAAIYTSGINSANVINNIITQCRGTAVVNDGMKIDFNYNLLWHNAGGDIFGLKFPIPNPSKGIVDGNIMKDPQFSLKTPTDFHITFGSPAKNAGYNNLAPSLDIDNEVRLPPPGGKVDIGADEFVDSDNDGGANIIDPTPNDFSEPDTDGDDIADPYDNCPTNYNPDQIDCNGDGIGDTCMGDFRAYFVDGSKASSGNGTTWATAFKTIQEGINAADVHNLAGWKQNPEVWVRGTDDSDNQIIYHENILIWHGVNVYGGWAGTEDPTAPDVHSTRNVSPPPAGHETIIDGGGKNPVVVIAHLPQDRYLIGTTKTAYDLSQSVLNGFTLRYGLDELGGGVSIYKETANISTCRIEANTAALGGGVYMYRSTGIVGDGIGPGPGNILNMDTTIIGNTATGVESYAGFGGGVYIERGSPSLFANIIQGNGAFFGGGVAAFKSSPIMVENLIGCRNNQNVAKGTSSYPGQGGGVYLEESDAVLDKDTIVDNLASGGSGQGGGIWAYLSDFRLKNSILAFNMATYGAAIFGVDSTPLITYSDFFGNGPDPFFGIADPVASNPSNKSVDPLFADVSACNYRLKAPDSPLIAAGDPTDNPGGTPPNMGAFQDVDPPVTIGEAKHQQNGVTVSISGGIVTAVFPDSIYIEQPDRVSGMKVLVSNAAVNEGQIVSVTGVVTTLGDEKQIINAQVNASLKAASLPLGPLGIPVRWLGGSSVGVALNNVGLLVRVWGRVTGTVAGANPYFLIGDGSGYTAKVLVPAGFTLPAVDKVVVATGISCIDIRNSDRMRAIRVRRDSDIIYPPR